MNAFTHSSCVCVCFTRTHTYTCYICIHKYTGDACVYFMPLCMYTRNAHVCIYGMLQRTRCKKKKSNLRCKKQEIKSFTLWTGVGLVQSDLFVGGQQPLSAVTSLMPVITSSLSTVTSTDVSGRGQRGVCERHAHTNPRHTHTHTPTHTHPHTHPHTHTLSHTPTQRQAVKASW